MLHRIGQKVIINVDIIPSLYLLASFCKAELVSGNGLYVGQLFNENS